MNDPIEKFARLMISKVDIVQERGENKKVAFDSLYDDYAPALFGMIKNVSRDERLATIILEKSFLKFWHEMESFDSSKERLFTWMVRLTVKVCSDVLKLTKEVILQRIKSNSSIQQPAQ